MKMKKIISVCLCIRLMSGCDRLQSGGNAENFDDTSGVVKKHHTPLSSAPANLPAPTTSPIPNPTVHAKPGVNRLDEICGKGNGVPYFGHSLLSWFVNSILILFTPEFPSLKILRMVSAFSFPVHVALTNLSFLSKSKISLVLLVGDTIVSLCKLNHGVVLAQIIFEFVRFIAYPHIANFLL